MFLGAIARFGFFLYYFFIGPLFFPPPSDPGTSPEPTATGTLPQTVTINGRIYNIDPQTGLPTTEIISQPPTTPLPDQQPSDRADGSITKTDKFIDDPAYYLTTIDTILFITTSKTANSIKPGPMVEPPLLAIKYFIMSAMLLGLTPAKKPSWNIQTAPIFCMIFPPINKSLCPNIGKSFLSLKPPIN